MKVDFDCYALKPFTLSPSVLKLFRLFYVSYRASIGTFRRNEATLTKSRHDGTAMESQANPNHLSIKLDGFEEPIVHL